MSPGELNLLDVRVVTAVNIMLFHDMQIFEVVI